MERKMNLPEEIARGRQACGKFRQQRQSRGTYWRRVDLSEAETLVQESSADSTPDRQAYGKFRQRRQRGQSRGTYWRRVDLSEAASLVQERSVATAEFNPMQVPEEPVRRGVQETQSFYPVPPAESSSINVQYQYFCQTCQCQHSYENVHYQPSYQYVQYQNEGFRSIHSCPCFIQGVQHARSLQVHQPVYHFQNYPYPHINSLAFPVQALPVAYPYYITAFHFECQYAPPFIVPVMMPQELQLRRVAPSLPCQLRETREESLTSGDDGQENQNRVQRDTHDRLLHKRHEKKRETLQSSQNKETEGTCERKDTSDGIKESTCKVKNQSDDIKDRTHKVEDRDDRIKESTYEVDGKNDKIKGRTREVTDKRDEDDQLTASAHEGKDQRCCVSDDKIAQITDRLQSELGLQVSTQVGQDSVEKFKYLTYGEQSHPTPSQGVQISEPVHIHELNRQGNSVAEKQSTRSKQAQEGKYVQESWEISQVHEMQGPVSTVEPKSISGGRQDRIIQQIQVPGQIQQELKSKGTQRDRRKEGDRNTKGLDFPLQCVESRIVICPFGRLPLRACAWVGKVSDRRRHVMFHHREDVQHGNVVRLAANRARILIAYDEMFLCYTYTSPTANKLYCATVHACKTLKCSRLYQYRCELRATCKYELIQDTRLVSSLSETFYALTKSGRCVRFDDEVRRSFMGDKVAVHFTIFRRKEFEM
jgi:hypothetical protein